MGPQVQPKCFRHVALIYFQKMLQVLTSHTSKLPKKVLKNTKNMTPNSCSVRPEKFHPYESGRNITVNLNVWSSLPGVGTKERKIQGFPDWRSSWKKTSLVSKASVVTDEQMVNWTGEILKGTHCLHLTWKSGFRVSCQEGVVNNIFLRSIYRKSKPVIYHPQSRCEAKLVSKKE